MTDRELIKKEIERLLEECGEPLHTFGLGKIRAFEKVLKFIDSLPQEQTIRGWLARDRGKVYDDLSIYTGECPYRDEEYGWWENRGYYMQLPSDIFPEVTWENEPVEVQLTIRKV